MTWLFDRNAEGASYLQAGFEEAAFNLSSGKNPRRHLALVFAAAIALGGYEGGMWGSIFYDQPGSPEWTVPQPVENIARNATIGAGVFGASFLAIISASGLALSRNRWRAENTRARQP